MDAREALVAVLRDARSLLARPEGGFNGNDFAWSPWDTQAEALAVMDGHVAAVEAGRLPAERDLALLFAPTGPIQEVSVSSGWGDEFLRLADRFDAALEQVYGEP